MTARFPIKALTIVIASIVLVGVAARPVAAQYPFFYGFTGASGKSNSATATCWDDETATTTAKSTSCWAVFIWQTGLHTYAFGGSGVWTYSFKCPNNASAEHISTVYHVTGPEGLRWQGSIQGPFGGWISIYYGQRTYQNVKTLYDNQTGIDASKCSS